MLTTLNHVNLGNLTNIRSIDAGLLTTRAWGTLRAVVHGVAPAKAPIGPTVTRPEDLQTWAAPGLPLMLRGAERC